MNKAPIKYSAKATKAANDPVKYSDMKIHRVKSMNLRCRTGL